jgi:hypothetical protein
VRVLARVHRSVYGSAPLNKWYPTEDEPVVVEPVPLRGFLTQAGARLITQAGDRLIQEAA